MAKTRKTLQTAGAILVFACGNMAALSTEKQIADLESEIALLRGKLEETGAAGDEVGRLLTNIDLAKKEISEAKDALGKQEKSVAGKEFLLGAYQSSFRIVTTLTSGQNLGTMVLKNGETVEPSSFLSAGKGSILVQTTTGSRSIPVGLLPASFGDRIGMPPSVNPPTTNLAALKAGKPDAVKTAEDVALATATATVPASGSSGAAGSPSVGTDRNYEAIQQRNDARMRQITDLKLQFSNLFTQKKVARSEKSASEKLFREATIKKSQSEISSTLKLHDAKINRIEAEEAALREQIARLQADME